MSVVLQLLWGLAVGCFTLHSFFFFFFSISPSLVLRCSHWRSQNNSRDIKTMEQPLVIYFIGLQPISFHTLRLFWIRRAALYRMKGNTSFWILTSFLKLWRKHLDTSEETRNGLFRKYMIFHQRGFSRQVSHTYPPNLFMSISVRAFPTAVRKQSVCSLGSDLADVCNSNQWN